MNRSEAQVRSAVIQEAAKWFVRHRSGELDGAGRASFESWLTASPLHIEEYLGLAQLAQDFPAAAADPEFAPRLVHERAKAADAGQGAEWSPSIPQARGRPRRRGRLTRWRVVNIAAGIAALGVALFWWGYDRPATEHFATLHGEQQAWQLTDHSIVRLNTDSAVSVRFSRRTRSVNVERGQVYFEVAHEPGRPFQVDAGGVSVTDLGTQFDLYREGRTTLVTVAEGRVNVAVGQHSLQAARGEQVRVQDGMSPVVHGVDLRRSTAWLYRQIDFQKQPLADVTREFNRYSTIPIIIEAPDVGLTPVSGVFAADDTASFVAFLRDLKGVAVEESATRIVVRELAPKAPRTKGPDL